MPRVRVEYFSSLLRVIATRAPSHKNELSKNQTSDHSWLAPLGKHQLLMLNLNHGWTPQQLQQHGYAPA